MRLVSISTALAAVVFAAPALAASPGEADICHWNDTGTAQVLTVSVHAVSAHVTNHGDSLAAIYFTDADGDGFGDADGATDRCPNAGFVGNNTDCDDADAAVSPGGTEVLYDGVDNDCTDGTADDDLDNDGFGIEDDCDDTDVDVNPGATDVCGDGIDNDCDLGIDDDCGGCPCFTAADIDAAYAAHLAIGIPDADYNRADIQCSEYTYSYSDEYYSVTQDGTQVAFDAFSAVISGDYYYSENYEASYAGFYGISGEYYFDGTEYADAYCINFTGTYSFDGTTNESEWAEDVRVVTDAEAEACEAIVIDWAADNGVDCPSYTY
jgi:hypothetical protein